jgi:alkylhydroperoxidase/carboxymuconolactone decarboxylase family protein YurZ
MNTDTAPPPRADRPAAVRSPSSPTVALLSEPPPRASQHLARHLTAAAELHQLDPAFADATEALVGHPYRHPELTPVVRALVVVAVEAVIPQADAPRLARVIGDALAEGASKAELLCTLEIACSIGLHTVSVGLPVLVEEMELAGLSLPPETERQRELQDALETSGPRPRPLNPIYAAILRMDPEYFAARVAFIDLPWTRDDVLDPEVKHLLSIAIDAVSPQHYVDGLRKHVREALAIGVAPAAVLEVLELASVTSLRTLDVGLEVLSRTS